MTLFFSPGCELHLIHGGVAQTVKIQAGQDVADVAATAAYNGFNAAVVHQANGTFTPVGVGQTVGLVSFTDAAGTVFSGFLRIVVHGALRQLRFGNQHITMRAGASDYVPTVLAEFDDMPIADVTGHAWVALSVVGNGVVSVRAGDPLGRLIASPTAAGSRDVVVATSGAARATVPVAVVASADTVRPILNPIWYHGPHTTRRNLLLLAEGFPDRDVFEFHVQKIIDLLFTSPAHSPYPQLKEHINVWTAFEGPAAGFAPEVGITVGPLVNADGEPLPIVGALPGNDYSLHDVTALVGLPPGPGAPADAAAARIAWAAVPGFVPARLLDPVFAYWQKQVPRGVTIPKDTTFGIMMGGRPCGPDSPEPQPATVNVPANANPHWDLFPFLTHVTMYPDPRRSPENAAMPGFLAPNTVETFGDFLEGYLESLKYGTDTGHVDHDVGRTWLRAGADAGLVAILVYEELTGGTQFGTRDAAGHRQRVALAWTLGNQQAIKVRPAGALLDHTVSMKDPSNPDRHASTPQYDVIAGNFAHELTHALGLGDEYEDIYERGQLNAANQPAGDFDHFSNVMHGSSLLDAHGQIVANQIKWNWPRIQLASPLAADVPVPPPGTGGVTTTIQLEPSQGMKWKEARNKRLDVFLRVRAINPAAPAFRAPIGPFKIHDITGDTIVLDGPFVSSLVYKAGSVLYLPASNAAGVRTIVDHAVRDDLVARGAFGVNSPLTALNREGESARKNIAGFKKPKHRESVIGVYEGGNEFNSGVYRPSGNCKMRQIYYGDTEWRWWLHFIPHQVDIRVQRGFCFVCKYILINEVWPGAFDLLDREYPEDC